MGYEFRSRHILPLLNTDNILQGSRQLIGSVSSWGKLKSLNKQSNELTQPMI